MELLKYHDCIINYHPDKANLVIDSLSGKYLFALKAMNAHLTLAKDEAIIAELRVKFSLFQQVQEAQK